MAALVLLLALAGGVAGWWHLRSWEPSRQQWPVQGVEVGADDGTIDWTAMKTIGVDFAYIDASASAFARDANFTANLEGARAVGLQVGALHQYDPCQPADKQAANFVTVVPRDGKLLPSAVELDRLAEGCPGKVTEAGVESELTTFLNQVETHTGKPVILKLSSRFEGRYHVASAIDRNLWLERTRLEPDYAGRPWTLWTANTWLQTEAAEKPLRWIAVQR
jgi:lysozyme